MLRLLFSRRWWWLTLLAIAAVLVMIRLGFWQLDRLEQRRAFNERVRTNREQPPLVVTGETPTANLPEMEFRPATVTGEYDPAHLVLLRNQRWNDEVGMHLLTPLIIEGSDHAVLVDRGWIPYDLTSPEQLAQLAEPGTVEVEGVIRRSQPSLPFGLERTTSGEAGRVTSTSVVNLDRIAEELPYPLLPVYIQQTSAPGRSGLPYPSEPNVELTEGSHLGYAIQWFFFAALLAIGYPAFVRHSAVGEAGRRPRPLADDRGPRMADR